VAILHQKHPEAEGYVAWLKSLPHRATVTWSAWNFAQSPITQYSVGVCLDGYNRPGHEEGTSLNIDDDMDMFVEYDEEDGDSLGVPFGFLRQQLHPELPVYAEKPWVLKINYNQEKWPDGAELLAREGEGKQALVMTPGLERHCSRCEYRLVDNERWMARYTIKDINNILTSLAGEYADRQDLIFTYRDWIEPESDEDDDNDDSVPTIGEATADLAEGSTLLFSSDHFSLTYPFGIGWSDVDFVVEDTEGGRWGYFFMLKEEPDSPADGLDHEINYFAPANGEMVFKLEEGELSDFYVVVGDKKYHTLPWVLGNEEYYAAGILADDGYYRIGIHTISAIERAATSWLARMTGHNGLLAIWDHGAPLSSFVRTALERLEDLPDYVKPESVEIGPGFRVNQNMLDWLERDSLGAEARYREQLRYLEDEGVIPPQASSG
jgi:hypothetical protein